MQTAILLILEAILLSGVFYGYIYRYQRKINILDKDLKQYREIFTDSVNDLSEKYNETKTNLQNCEIDKKSLADSWSEFFLKNQQLHLQLDFYKEQIGALKIAQVESEQAHVKDIQLARKDAVDTSRAVLKGQISEEIAPFLPEFPYDSSDVRFLGSPVDMVIFEGMSKGEITNIAIVDIKTGKSALNKVQKQIKECIENGRVSFYKHSI